MADVTTDVLRTANTDTLSKSSKVSTAKTMTVDKTVKAEQPAPGGTPSTSNSTKPLGQTSSATAAPRGSPPTQMKAAPGNVATASPRKQDSGGNSPQSKSSSADPPNASKSSLQPTQQQQLHASTKSSPKKNPWNRNPTANAPPASGDGKKSHVEGPTEARSSGGRTASEGASPLQKDPSLSIKIPKNEVPAVALLHLMLMCVHHFLY